MGVSNELFWFILLQRYRLVFRFSWLGDGQRNLWSRREEKWVHIRINIRIVYTLAPFGRRQWRMFFATVRGLTLYLHKNEKGFDGSRFSIFQNCIRLHHALAEIPHDYTKKSHVFRITTAKLGEYLIQTSSPGKSTQQPRHSNACIFRRTDQMGIVDQWDSVFI